MLQGLIDACFYSCARGTAFCSGTYPATTAAVAGIPVTGASSLK
jgi:hypothetical protein